MGCRWRIEFGKHTSELLQPCFVFPKTDGDTFKGWPGKTWHPFLLHGCTRTCLGCSPSTMLRIRASTGPLEGASGMCMVYSPTCSCRGFSLSKGWYSNKSSNVIIPPAMNIPAPDCVIYEVEKKDSIDNPVFKPVKILQKYRMWDLLPVCLPQFSVPWTHCKRHQDPPLLFFGMSQPALETEQYHFLSGCSFQNHKILHWKKCKRGKTKVWMLSERSCSN